MTELTIVRRLLLRSVRATPAGTPLAVELLGFGQRHGAWLCGLTAEQAEALDWAAFSRALRGDLPCAEPEPGALRITRELSALLGLDRVDAEVATAIVALIRLRRACELFGILTRHDFPAPMLVAEAAQLEVHEADARLRMNPLFQFGLVIPRTEPTGQVVFDMQWRLARLLDREPETGDKIVEALVGPRQEALLPLAAFGHVEDADFLLRLLEGARRERAVGVNILIHGPPGTGKTELARTLAAAAGLSLHGVAETDGEGLEPNRWERVGALKMGQRLLAGRGDAALMFDEMEDLIGDAQPAAGDWFRGRQGSKVFVNRMLETNPVPVIWTTNAIGNVDAAILRRMSFVLKLGLPSRAVALGMLERITREEGVTPGEGWDGLLEVAPEAASSLRVAARGAKLAGEDDGGLRPARALVKALRGREPRADFVDGVDLELIETDLPLGPLFDRIRESEHADVSLLLTGPPGTGKTALAHHFARLLDRPLLVRRASDLLSKWVGETEAQIAAAFEDARRDGAVLLFDEADSLLFDRSTARTSWEISQVNELLTWLDRHPLPVVAATNHAGRLDPATLRRFVFKLELRPLEPERAGRAFERFFSLPPPLSLAQVRGLTPGDFAVVARQLRHAPRGDAEAIVGLLKAEVAARPGAPGRIGF